MLLLNFHTWNAEIWEEVKLETTFLYTLLHSTLIMMIFVTATPAESNICVNSNFITLEMQSFAIFFYSLSFTHSFSEKRHKEREIPEHINWFRHFLVKYDSKLLCSITLWWYFKFCTFKSRCQIEPLVTGQTHESCSLFDSKLICNMTLLMIIHFLHFQVQISNWTSCQNENIWIPLAL